jgi:hypothetical protein
MITRSASLFRASKICFIVGAALTAFGAVGEFLPQYLVALQNQLNFLIPLGAGVALLAAGYYLRRKAIMIQRRFEWRDTYKQIQYNNN